MGCNNSKGTTASEPQAKPAPAPKPAAEKKVEPKNEAQNASQKPADDNPQKPADDNQQTTPSSEVKTEEAKADDTQTPAAEPDADKSENNGVEYDPSCPVLYINMLSPPSLSCLMMVKEAGIKVNIKTVDLMSGEHKKEAFTKINPDQCVPTLVDGNFVLWESRPVMKYLCQKYAPQSDFYPSDLKERATLDRLMAWDAITFSPAVQSYAAPAAFMGSSSDPALEPKLKEALEYLDKQLAGKSFICGDKMTIIDLNTFNILALLWYIDYNIESYSNIAAWAKRVEKLGCFGECTKGVAEYKKMLQEKAK